jgi:hypothetical protein
MALCMQRQGCTLDVGKLGPLIQDLLRNRGDDADEASEADRNDDEAVEAQEEGDEDEADEGRDANEIKESAGSQLEQSSRRTRAQVQKGAKGQGKVRKGGKAAVARKGRPTALLGRLLRKYDVFRSFI